MTETPRTRRRWTALAAGVGALTATAVAARRRRASRRTDEYRSRVRAAAGPVASAPYDPADVADLPAPVRRYFETVLEPGQPHVQQARLAQEGEFRLGEADAPWRPLTANQVYAVSPPGYVWDARIELLPLVSARVCDAYVAGEGLLRADLAGAVPVASAGPNPRMNEAELQRYLSETPWFPTGLLPAGGVTWEGVDDHTARATLADGDATATGVFHFDETGHVTRLTADRYRQDADAVAPWVGHYWRYEERDGMAIPTAAEVAWDTPEGEAPYWRGTVTDVEYRTGG